MDYEPVVDNDWVALLSLAREQARLDNRSVHLSLQRHCSWALCVRDATSHKPVGASV